MQPQSIFTRHSISTSGPEVVSPGAEAGAQGGNSVAILLAPAAVVATVGCPCRLGLACGVVDAVLLNTALVLAEEDLCGVVGAGDKVGV
jgi:hypothetical protein